MAKIIVYNNSTDRMETYYRGESQSMPYNTNGTLLVREFRGASNSSTLWTTKNTMLSWNSQRYLFGAPIPVGYAFRRPWEGRSYVLIAQDDLNTLGFSTGSLDGIFGTKTKNAVIRYQRSRGLTADGIIGCNTWMSLQENVVGTGRTSTTLD